MNSHDPSGEAEEERQVALLFTSDATLLLAAQGELGKVGEEQVYGKMFIRQASCQRCLERPY